VPAGAAARAAVLVHAAATTVVCGGSQPKPSAAQAAVSSWLATEYMCSAAVGLVVTPPTQAQRPVAGQEDTGVWEAGPARKGPAMECWRGGTPQRGGGHHMRKRFLVFPFLKTLKPLQP
jgi:hypothetical protein